MKKRKIIFLTILIFLISFVSGLYAQQQELTETVQKTAQNVQNLSEKISLDIKGMDIIDILKLLAMHGDLNIVAGKNVKGKVTLFLKNVEAMKVLEIVLAANDLTYEMKDNIISVMAEKDYEVLYGRRSYDKKIIKVIPLNFAKAIEVAKVIDQIKTKIGKVVVDEGSNTIVLIEVPDRVEELEEAIKSMDLPTVTKTFTLNYAKVEDLAEKLKESLTKNVGELKVDERMNKIIVTDLPKKMNYIEKVILDFDERDKVVLIEAKIIQITLNKDISYGINWSNIFSSKGINLVGASDLSVSLPTGISSWPTTLTYTHPDGTTTGDQVILKALERWGKIDVLSTPRIMVANKQEAKVLVGTKKAYVTSTVTQSNGVTTTADTVEFVDVGVRLAVIPTITGDGYINMKIKPEVSSAPTTLELTNSDGSIRTSIPIVTTSEVETQLLVKAGTTIIMAGLMKDTRIDNTEKIPFLGDIPFLRYFFRSKHKGNEKTELVVFLTPHIIEEGEDSSAAVQEYLRQHEETGLGLDSKPFEPISKSKTEEDIFLVSTKIDVAPEYFEQYCEYISDRVGRNLQKNKPELVEEQRVQLSFVLFSNGFLKGEPVLLNNVGDKVKEAVIKSVEESIPFFPFPKDYNHAEETFTMSVYFLIDEP